MLLKTLNGKKVLINDEAALSFMRNLENSINEFQEKSHVEGVTKEEEEKVKEDMYLYNQMVDILKEDNYGKGK